MRDDTRELNAASRALRESSFSRWSEFVKAFASYTDRIVDECVTASPAELPAAQARAQQARALMKVFTSTASTTKG